MEIRQITIDDLNKVFELLNDLYHQKLIFDTFQKIYKQKLNDKNCYYTVAIIDKEIVGVLTLEFQTKLHRAKKQSFIEDLVIAEKFRSKGIGTSLLEDAINYAINNDCEVVELTSYLDNERAHKFYETNGFLKHSYKFKKYLK